MIIHERTHPNRLAEDAAPLLPPPSQSFLIFPFSPRMAQTHRATKHAIPTTPCPPPLATAPGTGTARTCPPPRRPCVSADPSTPGSS